MTYKPAIQKHKTNQNNLTINLLNQFNKLTTKLMNINKLCKLYKIKNLMTRMLLILN